MKETRENPRFALNFSNYRDLFEKNSNIILIIDQKTGNIVHANPAAGTYYQYSYEELTSMNIYDINVFSKEEINLEMERAVLEKRNFFIFIHRLKNRELRKVEVSSTPIIIDGKEYLFSIIYDVREKITRQLMITGMFYESPNAMAILDENESVIVVNKSFTNLFGYSAEEIIGQKLEDYIVSESLRDEIMINLKQVMQGEVVNINSVRKSKTNQLIDVNIIATPHLIGKEIVGSLIVYTDITQLNRNNEYIKYLSYHDTLTDAFNRKYFEEKMKELDTVDNLPISIIFGDVNGLKLTNDIFGHKAGDQLLKISANILKKVCGDRAIVARVGGDEFAILLPKTLQEEVQKIVQTIRSEFAKVKVEALTTSISIGYETKLVKDESLEKVMETAENWMYKEKVSNRKNNNSQVISEIIHALHQKSAREETHSKRVSRLAKMIAEEMGMPETVVRKVKDAAYLHDIGKITLDDYFFDPSNTFTQEERVRLKQHTVVGYRILNLFDETIDLADSVLNHHEYWDGSGYPKGLSGEEIPLIARIITIAEAYDTITSSFNSREVSKEDALLDIESQAGLKYDPQIVKVFLKMMREKEID